MRLRLLPLVAILSAATGAAAVAQDATPTVEELSAERPKFKLGAGFGTGGLMLEPQLRLPYAAVRGTFGYGATSETFKFDTVKYDGDIQVGQAGLLFDVHPMANGLRLSVGAVTSLDEADITATSATVTVGGTTYTGAILEGTIDQKRSVQPVVAVGYGSGEGRWSVDVDLGARFQGTWNADLRNGQGSSVTISDSDLREEEADIEDELNDIKLLPYAKIGLTFSF